MFTPTAALPPPLPRRAAPQGSAERDAAVAVHPGLVNTALAAGYFKQMPPKLLRPLTDPFFTHAFCPYMLRRWVRFSGMCCVRCAGGMQCKAPPSLCELGGQPFARGAWRPALM